MKKWVCDVCGNVIEDAAPPELCPVCKVTGSHYHVPGEKPAEAPVDPEVVKLQKAIEGLDAPEAREEKTWVCDVCGHVHKGPAAPELCPVCKVTGSHFKAVD